MLVLGVIMLLIGECFYAEIIGFDSKHIENFENIIYKHRRL